MFFVAMHALSSTVHTQCLEKTPIAYRDPYMGHSILRLAVPRGGRKVSKLTVLDQIWFYHNFMAQMRSEWILSEVIKKQSIFLLALGADAQQGRVELQSLPSLGCLSQPHGVVPHLNCSSTGSNPIFWIIFSFIKSMSGFKMVQKANFPTFPVEANLMASVK